MSPQIIPSVQFGVGGSVILPGISLIIEKMHQWLENERRLDPSEPNTMVLATATGNGKVHSRVVAVR